MTLSVKHELLEKILEPFVDRARLDRIVDHVTLFGGLNDIQLTNVIRKLKKATFSHREIVFTRGEQASYIYIVLSGKIKLKFKSPDHPMTGHEYSQGQCFGITSVIGIQNHSVTTQAEGEVELLILSRKDLMLIFEEDQGLFGYLILNIARESCRRLNYLNDCFEESMGKQPIHISTTQA
ncbi:MAG: cyclic nucleotide-binding domain-containing protein [Cellvibrionaceae bacterium]